VYSGVPFPDTFLENSQKYYEILSLDEMMVRFSGRVDFKFSQQLMGLS
jgi:hypothetical protein